MCAAHFLAHIYEFIHMCICAVISKITVASVDGMVSGHFHGCFCTDFHEIQNGYVFWVKEDTHEGNLQNFEIYYCGRIFT